MFLLFLLILLFFIVKYDIRRQLGNKHKAFSFCVLILIILAAFRYRVGVDTMRLEDELKIIPPIWDLNSNLFSGTRFAPGFIVFCSFLKIFSSEFVFYQLVQSLIVNICCCRFIYKNTHLPFIALFFYFFAAYLFFCYETSREGLAIALFLLLYDEKLLSWRNLLAVILCPLVHYGAIFVVVVMGLRKIDFGKKKNLLFMGITFLVLWIVITPEHFNNIPILTTNEDLYYMYNHYFLESEGDDNLLYKIKILLTLFPLAFLIFKKKEFIIHKTDIYNGFVVYVFLIFCGSFLPIINRLGNYFIIDFLIVLTWLIPSKNSKNMLMPLCFMIVFNFSFMTVYFNRVANSNARYYRRFIPYHSILSMEKDYEREQMYKTEY